LSHHQQSTETSSSLAKSEDESGREERRRQTNSTPHSRVDWSQCSSPLVVVQGVEMEMEHLIGLAKAIPSSIVASVHFHSLAIALDRCCGIPQLDILVTHQRPGCEIFPINFQSSLETHNGFFVLTLWAAGERGRGEEEP
jgi:hypothetical protein